MQYKFVIRKNKYCFELSLPGFLGLVGGGQVAQGGGQDNLGYLAPQGTSCPGGQDKLLHRNELQSVIFLKLNKATNMFSQIK